MAFKPTRMNQVKSILKDVLTGESIKKTSRIHGVSKNTVKKYLVIFKSSGIDISQMDQMSDESFHRLFYEQPSSDSPEYFRNEKFKELLLWFINESGRHGVTRETIYKQYILDHPTGYSYSRFCRKLKEHRTINEATIRIEHKAGYRMMVDFTGKINHQFISGLMMQNYGGLL